MHVEGLAILQLLNSALNANSRSPEVLGSGANSNSGVLELAIFLFGRNSMLLMTWIHMTL
jgi:hypothetical protein